MPNKPKKTHISGYHMTVLILGDKWINGIHVYIKTYNFCIMSSICVIAFSCLCTPQLKYIETMLYQLTTLSTVISQMFSDHYHILNIINTDISHRKQ